MLFCITSITGALVAPLPAEPSETPLYKLRARAEPPAKYIRPTEDHAFTRG